jgi:energy-coupling factor transport system permease protein
VTIVPVYRRLPSPLHAAGAGVGALYCMALGLAALVHSHPLVLATILLAVLAAGAAAGVGRQLAGSLKLVVPFGLLVVLINALISQDGLTVVFRGGEILGREINVTAESLAWGGVTALRLACLFLAFGLMSAVVDPDGLMRLMRRVSYRSALTGSLTTRLVPVIARDAGRMNDAARCRPRPPGRLEVTRAALTNALERAVEVAAALELRGYGAARPPRRERRRWSRHDASVALAALLVAALAVGAAVAGVAEASFVPTVELALGAGELALCAALLSAALVPFLAPRARLGLARA